jgi:spoIIIJ-associated protein
MQSVETEGHSIDDAIEQALQRLGVSRDKVDIEILANAARGLFGLGGRRAKVRATVRRPLALDAGESTPAAPAATTPAASRDTRAEERPRPAAPPARPASSERRDPSPRPAPPPAAHHAPPPRPAPETAPPLSEASLERARVVLTEIIRLTGSEASILATRDADGVRLVISGDPSGLLIGRRGQTLDALEYLLHRIVAHGEDTGARLVVDAENYRLRRRESLEDLARRVAERARRSGKPITLSPMSPRDRRIVHLALQGDTGMTTRSAGSGFYRKIVIAPAGARRPPRQRQE